MKSLVLLAIASGCSLYEPDVGVALGETPVDAAAPTDADGGTVIVGCDNADSDPTTPVSFALDVRPLMTRSPGGCAACHLGRITSGLDLSSYASMRRGGINTGTKIIVSSVPCESILLQKLGRTPPFGSRMPFNGPPYFSAEERQLVRDWIAEGALNN
ncbi:MAG: hypothetical protein H0V17_34985 [Deltaproteobacteria bacterium]|nr:hypothetical protein [Deltaproteobacteria bacterium]